MKNDHAFATSHTDVSEPQRGFTKLELGTFMIAQGLVSNFNFKQPTDQDIIATIARQIAETILIELEKFHNQ